MTPETNHDVEISIYHDFLEDQGIYVDRDTEEQDQWHYESKFHGVGGGVNNVGCQWSIIASEVSNVGDGDYVGCCIPQVGGSGIPQLATSEVVGG